MPDEENNTNTERSGEPVVSEPSDTADPGPLRDTYEEGHWRPWDNEWSDEIPVVDIAIQEATSDGNDTHKESSRLIAIYNSADDAGKVLIDEVLRCVCGWTLPTLHRMATEEGYNESWEDNAHQRAEYERFRRSWQQEPSVAAKDEEDA